MRKLVSLYRCVTFLLFFHVIFKTVIDSLLQLMTEKGNHIKLKRELQAVLADMKQLQAENVDMSKQIEVNILELYRIY